MQTISSKDNPRIKQLVKLQKSARTRRECGLFLAEGLRICRDAMLSYAQIETLYATGQAAEKFPNDFSRLSVYARETILLTPAVFAHITDTHTPQ